MRASSFSRSSSSALSLAEISCPFRAAWARARSGWLGSIPTSGTSGPSSMISSSSTAFGAIFALEGLLLSLLFYGPPLASGLSQFTLPPD